MRFYYVYVLHSKKDRDRYIGFTSNLKKRIADHDCGNNKSTANRRPLVLIYYEAHRKKEKALAREKYFKTTKGKRVLS